MVKWLLSSATSCDDQPAGMKAAKSLMSRNRVEYLVVCLARRPSPPKRDVHQLLGTWTLNETRTAWRNRGFNCLSISCLMMKATYSSTSVSTSVAGARQRQLVEGMVAAGQRRQLVEGRAAAAAAGRSGMMAVGIGSAQSGGVGSARVMHL